MAGKVPVTESELKKALEMLCVADGKQVSEGEDQGKKRYLLSPGDIIVRLEEGRIVTDSQSTYEKLCETLMEMRSSQDRAAAQRLGPQDRGERPDSLQRQEGRLLCGDLAAEAGPLLQRSRQAGPQRLRRLGRSQPPRPMHPDHGQRQDKGPRLGPGESLGPEDRAVQGGSSIP